MSQQDSGKTIHQGRNIKRFREMLGIKQDAFAAQLGEDWTQRRVSLLEAKESVDEDVLKQVAAALKLPKEALENFDEERAINILSNTVNNNDHSSGNSLFSYYPTINPIEKWLEALEENKKLYERLLQSEREKVELLQKMVKI